MVSRSLKINNGAVYVQHSVYRYNREGYGASSGRCVSQFVRKDEEEAAAESRRIGLRSRVSGMAFKEIPMLDLSEGRSEETKAAFLIKLREALLETGFLYLKNTGIDQATYDNVCEEGIKFFDIPEQDKLDIEMKQKARYVTVSKIWYILYHPDAV